MSSTTMSQKIQSGTEVRNLRKMPRAHYGLVEVLEDGSVWKQVMALVRRTPSEAVPCPIKYTSRHIQMVVEAGEKQKRSCAEIFLEEWGCSGRKRPTLADLLSLLIQAQLFKAADYVAVQLLNEPRPNRPECGPAAEVLIPTEMLPQSFLAPTAPPESNSVSQADEFCSHDMSQAEPRVVSDDLATNHNRSENGTSGGAESVRIVQQMQTVPIDQIDLSQCTPQHISYKDLQAMTNDFDCNPVGENNGRLLGKGAFGSVHLAIQDNHLTAVKRLNQSIVNIEQLFQNELEALWRVQHPNLLRMVAFSSDGPENCLVYEYMSQGDLEERLSCKGRWEIPLTFLVRLRIALGTSKGLKHLHEYRDPPLVHRDVKSANILLDKDLVPKLGDFGLVHQGDSADGNSSAMLTSTVFGTSVYMAPETMRGEVSVKSDVFSIGVVLLELLTGLSPYDADGDGLDLTTYVSNECEDTIRPLLDHKAGSWTSDKGLDLSAQLFSLAQDCLEEKHNRPFMADVVERLNYIINL